MNFLTRLLILAFLPLGPMLAQQYSYKVDLQSIEKDRVKVSCMVPEQTMGEVDFIFPNIIPGSYSFKEFGRYIEDFRAFDEKGNKLKVKKADKHNFRILGAKGLKKIEYYVNDSWEEKKGKKFIFQPGGTNINAGKNFVLNNYGFFGYIDGMKDIGFNIVISKPSNLKGYSYLRIITKDQSTDTLTAVNYDQLADNPIMYCPPQEASFKVGNSEINISVYSENNKVSAAQMAEIVKPIAAALEHFFGVLPVDRYMFIFYLADRTKVPEKKGKGLGSGFGALEHNHCSFYFMPESSNFDYNKEMLSQVCAHEFLHILTPLNLHSREIEDFNFRTPVMSEHLWLYEGVTEYFSQLVQLQEGIITMQEFMKIMRSKMIRSSDFDSFSMTEMSKNVLLEENQARYLSVYSRGAVLAMMLDLLIIDKSDGKNSLQQVLMKLTKKYGPSKPFSDSDLIPEIISMTSPEVEYFFNEHIIGRVTPDYAEYFKLIGYDYLPVSVKKTFYFGRFGIKYDEAKNNFYFSDVEAPDILGILDNDVLVRVNDIEVTKKNIDALAEEFFFDNDEWKPVKLDIIRGTGKIILEANPVKVIKRSMDVISVSKDRDRKSERNLEKFKRKAG